MFGFFINNLFFYKVYSSDEICSITLLFTNSVSVLVEYEIVLQVY